MGQSTPIFPLNASEATIVDFYALGVQFSCGMGTNLDLIEAHKYFNLAAMRGDAEAAHRRQEIAQEMNSAQIAIALRRAREALRMH